MIIDDSLNGSAENYKSNLSFENQITAYSGYPPSSPYWFLFIFLYFFAIFVKVILWIGDFASPTQRIIIGFHPGAQEFLVVTSCYVEIETPHGKLNWSDLDLAW